MVQMRYKASEPDALPEEWKKSPRWFQLEPVPGGVPTQGKMLAAFELVSGVDADGQKCRYDTDGYKYSPSEVSSWEDYCWDADESAAVPTTGTLEAALRSYDPTFFNTVEGEMCLAGWDFNEGSALDLVSAANIAQSEVTNAAGPGPELLIFDGYNTLTDNLTAQFQAAGGTVVTSATVTQVNYCGIDALNPILEVAWGRKDDNRAMPKKCKHTEPSQRVVHNRFNWLQTEYLELKLLNEVPNPKGDSEWKPAAHAAVHLNPHIPWVDAERREKLAQQFSFKHQQDESAQAEAEDFAKDVEEDLNPKSGWARVSAYCMLFLAESP
eukprot:g31771.t1